MAVGWFDNIVGLSKFMRRRFVLVCYDTRHVMEMHQVRYFVTLAETLNFTRAAEQCHVSQPALTRAIKLLEAEFGGPLLRRERRNTHLSELGALMLPYMQEVLAGAEAAKQRAATFRGGNHQLRLGVMCTIAPDPLVALVEAMGTAHPNVTLELTDAPAPLLEEQLLAGDLDLALYCRLDRENPKLHNVKIFSERMVIVLPPNHTLCARPALRLPDLNNQRYLNRANCEFNGAAIMDACGASWTAVYKSERDDWILAMVAIGMGFGFLPEYSVTHPGVVMRFLIEPEVTRDVDVVTVRGRPHSAAAGAFLREALRHTWPAYAGRTKVL